MATANASYGEQTNASTTTQRVTSTNGMIRKRLCCTLMPGTWIRHSGASFHLTIEYPQFKGEQMEIEAHRIQEFDDLIQMCINGDSNSRSPLDSIAQELGFAELEKLIIWFSAHKKYQHVHYFICEMYQRFDKISAVKLFLINGENFAPSLYWAALHYSKRQDYGKSKDIFEKGYRKHHWFCGKELADLYMYGDLFAKLRGIKLKIKLGREIKTVHRGGHYNERFIFQRFFYEIDTVPPLGFSRFTDRENA